MSFLSRYVLVFIKTYKGKKYPNAVFVGINENGNPKKPLYARRSASVIAVAERSRTEKQPKPHCRLSDCNIKLRRSYSIGGVFYQTSMSF